MSLKDLFNRLFHKESSEEDVSLSDDDIENFMDSTWSFDELERIAKF